VVAGCKTVGSAYVGSNPTPATTCENGPLAVNSWLGGPFPSCHAVYQGASLRVDAWQCPRTYSGQRAGKISGAYNRSLCRSAPVLSRYPGSAAHPGRPALRRPARARRRALFVPAAGAAAGSARAISSRLHRADDRVCVAATGMEDQHGAAEIDAVPGSGRRGSPRRHAARVPGVPGQGLDPAEPVMYLSWTGDGPVIYLPYTCAGDAPDHEAAMPACGRCEPGAQSADIDLAKESGAFHRRRSSLPAGPGPRRR